MWRSSKFSRPRNWIWIVIATKMVWIGVRRSWVFWKSFWEGKVTKNNTTFFRRRFRIYRKFFSSFFVFVLESFSTENLGGRECWCLMILIKGRQNHRRILDASGEFGLQNPKGGVPNTVASTWFVGSFIVFFESIFPIWVNFCGEKRGGVARSRVCEGQWSWEKSRENTPKFPVSLYQESFGFP